MQTAAGGAPSTGLYHQPLNVRGHRLRPAEAATATRLRRRLRLDRPVEEEDATAAAASHRTHATRRQKVVQVVPKRTECSNREVCSKELKQIYRTKETDDFRRIFQHLYRSDAFRILAPSLADRPLARLDPDALHRRHFARHYRRLVDLIA
ncbi:uncharacterized protein LOC126265791 [Aethina tumida]|uniref:uncharacterized protein LOC126265791 n=1 Tax=Aethina tumida TaxID=116153 RepID=UPI002148F693|nr:uncharacterized protein LOC126265791 [Aethina tumida]